jgi:hypothetical protein
VLDLRLYRAAFLPAVLAVIVAAFVLESREPPIVGSTLAPDAFDGRRAISELDLLSSAFPDRRPGGADDGRLAATVAAQLRAGGEFDVSTRRFDAQTADGERSLTTVVGVRQGLDPRRIVVMAHRDALQRGSRAQLSGTAALLELARVFRAGRSLRRTLVLVSTSGGSAGLAGAREFAKHPGGPVDAVLVLGDMAGVRTRKPLVVPFSNGLGVAPPRLAETARLALRTEAGLRSGGYRLPGRIARLAFPLTLSEQGELNDRGSPAVLLSASGERGPGGEEEVSRRRLQSFGRAALRTVTAIDSASPIPRPTADLGVQTKILPGWAVRLVTGLLILPALVAAVDGFARVRRRRQPVRMWLRWTITGAIPFVLAALLVWLLRILGLIPAPGAPVPPGAVPVDAAAIATMAGAAVVMALGWFVVRPAVLRLMGVRGRPEMGGAGAAVALLTVAVVSAAWLANPYAAALLLPALHVWLLAAEPRLRVGRSLLASAAVLALAIPLGLVALLYMREFGMNAVEAVWMLVLLVAGGAIGLGGVLIWSLIAGCLLSLLAVIRRRPKPEPPERKPAGAVVGPARGGPPAGRRSVLRS